MRRFSDIKSYMKDVTEIIWRYIRNMESYPKNALLAVQPDIMATVIDSPDQCRQCEFYALNLFISKVQRGQLMPNTVAIARMAHKYYSH